MSMRILPRGLRGGSLEAVANCCPVGIGRDRINNQTVEPPLIKGVQCGVEAACVCRGVLWHRNHQKAC